MRGITIDWSQIDWKWIFTTLLAVYAAVISTYREVAARRQWIPDVRVKLSLDIIAFTGRERVPKIQVWVENHGRSELQFNSHSVSIKVKGVDNAWLMADAISSATFPYALKSGGSFYYLSDKLPLIDELRKAHPGQDSVELQAFVFDAIARRFDSEWRELSLVDRVSVDTPATK